MRIDVGPSTVVGRPLRAQPGPTRRSLKARVAILALALAAVALSACDAGLPRVTRNDHKAFDVPIGAHTDVAVSTFNGHINVTAVGEGKVDVSVTAYARAGSTEVAQSALASVAVTFEQREGTLLVAAVPSGDGAAGSQRGADIDVVLPRNSSLTLVTTNGRIEAINVQGSVIATTTNGEIVSRGGHDLHLDTSNGTITMSRPAGRIVARTQNAAVDILDADHVAANVLTTDAAIAFSGSLAAGEQLFRTSDASLSLRLPADQGFSIDGHTANATATTDFPGLTASAGSLTGTVGDGSARITAETSNAALSVARLAP